ncbi:VOC family protein [Actinotalea sp. M2MS4P-6]|uniref:VOC family protein n=1 Tax=Actinotalea sp. M2MS4P-6 TaxID=2983762 RepID=UPI0021E49639|nr:VOC family protein [Actinotalea sp. M2MS4P-6]MCV2394703.1 VOC family protein [Actinotalea sp. M2MS4P-6]
MDRHLTLTFDAADPRGLGTFWASALGYVEEPPPTPFDDWPSTFAAWGLPEERWNDAYAIVDPDDVGPRVFLQKVPEPKTSKNRMHLDVGVPGYPKGGPLASPDEVRANAARLVALGATIVREFDEDVMGFWIVMADPEGNEFCAVR